MCCWFACDRKSTAQDWLRYKGRAMQRSIGVMLSAVVVFIGCAVFILAAVLIAFTTQTAPAASAIPFMKGALIFQIVLDLLFVGWGISSGIGLLKLQPWARISMIVFSGMMAFFCLLPMVIFLRVVVELFFAAFLALAIFWIYFFNRKNVKAQFQSGAAQAAQAGVLPATEPKRPVPILVLGVVLIVAAASLPFALMIQTPVLLFGFVLSGSSAKAGLAALAALSLAAGVGLVKMRTWGWALALFAQAVNIVNVLCFLLIPGAAEHLQAAMSQLYGTMGIDLPAEFASATVMRLTYGFGFLLAMAIVWILLAYRKAFDENSTP
jgi:hypothetical protein